MDMTEESDMTQVTEHGRAHTNRPSKRVFPSGGSGRGHSPGDDCDHHLMASSTSSRSPAPRPHPGSTEVVLDPAPSPKPSLI